MRDENQHTEFKKIWKDDFLKSICAFANAQGGTLYVGVNNNGEVIGVDNFAKLLEDLPNKIRNILGLIPQINHKQESNKDYLEIIVSASKTPVSYHGHFYYRSGSTIQDLSGGALEHFLLAKRGKKWDGVIAENFSMDDLSKNAFTIFRKRAQKSKRIPDEDINAGNKELLEALNLTEKNQLLRAAVLCFGKDAEKLITGAFVKIGFFRTHSDLLYQDVIEGSLIEQVEKTIDLLTTKYMKANIGYEGITRTETYDYPEKALREAVLNAIIHKDYSSNVPVQISVYDSWLMIYNSGRLPEGWTLETLKQKHSSIPANPDIARVFFRAGYIENWGRGISDIVKYCKGAGLPEPFYKQMGAGFALVFEQEEGAANFSYEQEDKEDVGKNVKTSGKTSEKMSGKTSGKIMFMIKQDNKITIPELADKIGVTERSIERNIETLKQKGLLKRVGPAKGGHWKVITVE
ncbi:MAG: putative DNA binding domain-containing protein [Bacteroidales bacterium]